MPRTLLMARKHVCHTALRVLHVLVCEQVDIAKLLSHTKEGCVCFFFLLITENRLVSAHEQSNNSPSYLCSGY